VNGVAWAKVRADLLGTGMAKNTELSDRANLLGRAVRSDDPSASGASIQAVQEQVDGVTVIMRNNMQQLLEREDALSSLAKKAEATTRSAGAFHIKARGARRGMQLELCKTNLLIAAAVLLSILLLLWWFGLIPDFLSGGDGDETMPPVVLAPPATSSSTRPGVL